jgi:hypothetical protein
MVRLWSPSASRTRTWMPGSLSRSVSMAGATTSPIAVAKEATFTSPAVPVV